MTSRTNTKAPPVSLAAKLPATVETQADLTQADEENDPTFLRLPSGSWVRFLAIDEVSNGIRKKIRAALNSKGGEGDATNSMYDVAMKLMILEWNIVAPASAVGMAIPAHFAAGIDLLGARDGKAIERHLKPIFETINEGDDPKAQGDSDE